MTDYNEKCSCWVEEWCSVHHRQGGVSRTSPLRTEYAREQLRAEEEARSLTREERLERTLEAIVQLGRENETRYHTDVLIYSLVNLARFALEAE